MKSTPFSLFFILLIVPTLYLPSSSAQNYTQWGLPEGAKARIGKGALRDIQYSPDGAILAISGSIGVWLYDTKTYQELALLRGDRDNNFPCISFSPEGTTLVSGRGDTIILWDIATRKPKRTIDNTHCDTVLFNPNGLTFATEGYGQIHFWSVEIDGPKMTLPKQPDSIHCMAFNRNGDTFASGSEDGRIRLWHITTGKSKKTLTGHTEAIYGVSFSPDGETLASRSKDHIVRLWDPETGTLKKNAHRTYRGYL